jgi:AraC family transcriptional regulator
MIDGRWKLPPDNLLTSSAGRNWSGIEAETRRHSAGEVPEMVADRTVVGLAVRGNPASTIHRRGNGIRQATAALTGTVWLCPSGVAEDSIRITDTVPEMLHVYLSPDPFSTLSQEDCFSEADATSIRYKAGFRDPLIGQLGQIILSEMAQPTSCGKLLVEAAGLMLAARLVHDHANAMLRGAAQPVSPAALDRIRLRRVLEFMDANLESELGVRDLAAVACLSQFHFSRAFRQATGKSPHRFISERRLERAKSMLAQGTASLAEIALICSFSSQANFTRAFSRATGLPPGEYRRRAR